MIVFYWVAGVAIALTAVPALLYFVAYVTTGEDGCQRRALIFYRWALTLALASFNIAIFRHVIGGVAGMMR
jgi:hypothetical protein